MRKKRTKKDIEARIRSNAIIDVWDKYGRKVIEDGKAVKVRRKA